MAMDKEREALVERPFTDEQLTKTLQMFRRELDKNMELSNSSHSPGHDAMRVALNWLFADIAALTAPQPADGVVVPCGLCGCNILAAAKEQK